MYCSADHKAVVVRFGEMEVVVEGVEIVVEVEVVVEPKAFEVVSPVARP